MDSSYAAGSHNYMIAIQKTVKPMWEVRSTYDICADIAGHLGLREQYTEGRTQAQWAEMHYQQIREKRPYLPEWSVAKEMGVIDQRIATEQQSLAFADFRADAEANPLSTPSGKIEIYSPGAGGSGANVDFARRRANSRIAGILSGERVAP